MKDIYFLIETLSHRAIALDSLNSAFLEKRNRNVHVGWHEVLYMLVRIEQPSMVFETGVFDGDSSAFILQALDDNGMGQLLSIDLPAVETIAGSTNRMSETTLPTGCQPGWCIPDSLRYRHELLLGDSRQLLLPALQQHGKIDIFFHDSLHTYEHQRSEYQTAWSFIKNNGFLISDDIDWSIAFWEFTRQHKQSFTRTDNLGIIKKMSTQNNML